MGRHFKLATYVANCIGAFLLAISSCDWIDGIEELGNDYQFVYDGSRSYISGHHEIHGCVLSYSANENYILALEEPDTSLYLRFITGNLYGRYLTYCQLLKDSVSLTNEQKADSQIYKFLLSKGISDRSKSDDKAKVKVIADSIFYNTPFYKKVFSHKTVLWIIDHRRDSLIGPLTKTEFIHQVNLLRLPSDMVDDLKMEQLYE